VYCASANLVAYPGGTLVIGNGSVFHIGGSLRVTDGLTIAGEGEVCAASMNDGGFITVSGGGLFVTNGLGTGALTVGNNLTLNGGTVTVDSLSAQYASVNFNGGTLNTKATVVSDNGMFTVGDGTDAASLHLDSGGSGAHSFANGLTISSNAFLTGCGTIEGSVIVNPGGTVLANCGGTMTFTGIVTNNGTMRAINGSVLETYSNLVNNGTIDVINGATNFLGGFINNGTVLTASSVKISQFSKSGKDMVIQIPSFSGHTYQLQFTPTLQPANWMSAGVSQSGTNGVVLTFTDSGGATNLPARFYRVDVSAP
jgi:fibronectin-binding autotransporter adhesin